MLAQHGCLLQVEDVTAVQNVETAVRKDDGFPFLLPIPYLLGHFLPGKGLIRLPTNGMPIFP